MGGAVLVDVRSEDERRRQGVVVPGALHHPLSVVHWRLDPAVRTRNPKLALDAHVIVLCREGYSSSLAAALLRVIGFPRATDVVGGVDAWREAGLPLEPYEEPAVEVAGDSLRLSRSQGAAGCSSPSVVEGRSPRSA